MAYNKCYIVAAGDNSGTDFSKEKNDYVIAVDGGLKKVEEMGISPNLIIGDFDSYGSVPDGKNVKKYPTQKNDTDMMLALKEAVKLPVESIEIYGGTGGRIDHTIANIQSMLFARKVGKKIKMIDKSNVYQVAINGKINLEKRESGIFSVLSIDGSAYDVTITGAKYEMDHGAIFFDEPVGISNEFVGKDVEVSVLVGCILVITERV